MVAELKVKELGLEYLGITIPWDWVDSILCGLIEKGDAGVLTDMAVEKVDAKLQEVVDNTSFRFDNVGKGKLEKAFTLSMVKKFMPELLPGS